MNRQAAHRYFRHSGRLILTEHNGQLYATDSYLCVPCDDSSPIAALLTYWNLPVEPGVFFVEDRVRRNEGAEVPQIGKFFGEAGPGMSRVEFLGSTDWSVGAGGRSCSVFETRSGQIVALDEEKRAIVEALCGFGYWHGNDAVKPAHYVTQDGDVMGLLMPVRTTLQKAAAKPSRKRAAA